jgi:2-polyprenyl-6-methoxyphenol hydroxylase-like FAD-dependent oxidoreductase
MKNRQKEAIVIGGGIGGLCAGLALQQVGHKVMIFERAPEMHPAGAGIAVWNNGLAALQSLGLDSHFLQTGSTEMLGTVRTADGAVLSDGTAEIIRDRLQNPIRCFHRADLQQALINAVGHQHVHLGKACVHIEDNGERVTAVFADGSRVTGDFLIGADGIHSVVRQQLHGEQPAKYSGYTAWRAVIPFDASKLFPGETWGRGLRFGQLPLSGDRVYWFATRSEPADGRAPNGEKAYLRQLFTNWHAPIPELITATDETALLRNDIYDRDPLRWWGTGHTTLLGDAAHPMTPNMGQGACQAMEDAVVLRNCLQAEGSIEPALRHYEQQRIARTTKFVMQSRRIGQVGQWQQPLAVTLRNQLVKLTPAHLQANQLLQLLAFEPS